ncbi:hypothetical protein ACIRRH_43740 [Kitasatospora sp. NPDC101235]|uniref:rolling circle replication-associated protein n=1 Tax=Kitasatospora sp. NPDC101235 TaxID=3364101 RepID=UPI00382C6CE7
MTTVQGSARPATTNPASVGPSVLSSPASLLGPEVGQSGSASGSVGQAAGPAAAGGSPQGLVTSAKTVRENETAGQSLDLDTLFAPTFPTRDDLSEAAGTFAKVAPWGALRVTPYALDGFLARRGIGHEGPRPRIVIAPGVVRLEAPDLAKRERSMERHADDQTLTAKLDGPELKRYLDAVHGWKRDDDDQVVEVEKFDGTPAEWMRRDKGETSLTGREVFEWSRKSRARMILRMAELDWAPLFEIPGRIPAMVTLTYPGEWESVAGDGKEVKRHLVTFLKRYERAWGGRIVGVWKLEFQRRGAPHFHILMVPPHGSAGALERELHAIRTAEWKSAKQAGLDAGRRPYRRAPLGDALSFPTWLSLVWADVVDHQDPEERRKHEAAGTGIDYAEGMKASDPKRLAMYFAKHGSYAAKEYQHEVPDLWKRPGKGPGRFWGYWGIEVATVAVEVDWEMYLLTSRTMRRWAARTRIWDPKLNEGKGGHRWVKAVRTVRVPRGVNPETGVIKMRNVTRPIQRMTRVSGFLCVNNGPEFAKVLSRLQTLT